MTSKVQLGIVVLIALAGCGSDAGRASVPTAPSSPTPPQSVATGRQPSPWPPGVLDSNVTLSGVVFEIANGSELPIERAWVYCELCGEETHSATYTDARGVYSFKGIWGTVLSISVSKEGYEDPAGPTNTGFPNGPGWRDVTINGDTRFNIQLARK